MDYEKAYKEALNRAKHALDCHNQGMVSTDVSLITSMFPELKESEDEKERKALIEMVHDTTGDELWVDYNVHKEEALAWLEKQGEQKPTEWSKEDENRFQNIIACIEDCYNEKDAQDLIRWFKSLRPQPKQEWSDEDEKMYKIALSCIETLEDISKGKNMHTDIIDWLNTLKNRIGG